MMIVEKLQREEKKNYFRHKYSFQAHQDYIIFPAISVQFIVQQKIAYFVSVEV